MPCPPPGYLTNPGIDPRSPALQADSYLLGYEGSPGSQIPSMPTGVELGKTEQNRWVREMSQPRRGRSGSETLASVTGQHPEVGGPQGGGSYSKCEDLEALSMISLDHAPTEGVAV